MGAFRTSSSSAMLVTSAAVFFPDGQKPYMRCSFKTSLLPPINKLNSPVVAELSTNSAKFAESTGQGDNIGAATAAQLAVARPANKSNVVVFMRKLLVTYSKLLRILF
jgi:hypothetical protein